MTDHSAEIIYLPIKITSEEQRRSLWEELEAAERKAEDLKRILGILGTEKGLE